MLAKREKILYKVYICHPIILSNLQLPDIFAFLATLGRRGDGAVIDIAILASIATDAKVVDSSARKTARTRGTRTSTDTICGASTMATEQRTTHVRFREGWACLVG